MTTLVQFEDALRRAHDGALPLDDDQHRALRHGFATPLWIVAGPGTGKTHSLVWLVLKRLLVDGVPPDRVVLTTFTEKAARELESRLLLARDRLIRAGLASAAELDVAPVWLGTLHSLCARILHDHRYEPTLRIRVLQDDVTQQFFVRRSRNTLVQLKDVDFWRHFGMAKDGSDWPPRLGDRTKHACSLFNRLTENRIEPDRLIATGDSDLVKLADAYAAYRDELAKRHRTDQAHLQRHFLDFLDTPPGREWVADGLTVVVDEYQDTNPIQEAIYFRLAGARGDFTVVGDDDQSLYRFRGATVESLIDFDQTCDRVLGRTPAPVYLRENRRSHPGIVAWANRFIGNHPEMRDPRVRVRAPGKPPLVARANLRGEYPAVMAILERSQDLAAGKVAACVRSLADSGMIRDYSNVAILAFSVRETSHGIGAYTRALRALGIPVYNPRNRSAHVDGRFLALLGALCAILDPTYDPESPPERLPGGVPEYLAKAWTAYRVLATGGAYPDLVAYVQRSAAAIARGRRDPQEEVTFLSRQGGRRVTLSHLLFKLLSHEPFATDLTDAEGGERLKALNLVLAEYESLYRDGELRLEPDPDAPDDRSRISLRDLYDLYSVLVEGIHDGLDDPQDDEVSIQPGAVNVMTIHQAKGLEFDVVFVVRPEKQPWASDTHVLEDELDPLAQRLTQPGGRRSREERAAEDAVRLYFVAYSRAKQLLVIAGQKPDKKSTDKWDRVLGRREDGTPLNSADELKTVGVRIM